MDQLDAKYKRHYESQKEKILHYAKLLFMEKGIQQTTIADIAIASSMTRATIYRYFTSKDELLKAILYTHMTCFYRLIDEALACATTTYERFVQISQVFINQYELNEEYSMHSQIFQDYYLRSSASSTFSWQNEYNERNIKPGDLVHSLLKDFHDGSVDEHLDPKLTAMSFIYNCNYIIRCAFDNCEALPLKYNVQASDYIQHAIKVQLAFIQKKSNP